MLTPQETSDQIEIAQVLNRYFRAIDTRDWAMLDSVFTTNAAVYYDTPGEIETTYDELRQILPLFTLTFRFTQHDVSQMLIHVDGDRAESGNNLRAIHVQETLEGEQNTWVVYGAYRDQLRRTADGWRIVKRDFRGSHNEGELLAPDRVKSFPAPPQHRESP